MSIVILELQGLSCQNCVRHVKEDLSKVGGVEAVKVNLHYAWISGSVVEDELIQAVRVAGYNSSFIIFESNSFFLSLFQFSPYDVVTGSAILEPFKTTNPSVVLFPFPSAPLAAFIYKVSLIFLSSTCFS